jgi:peptidoglycan/LPS O-acetylase OafA/YrhL
MTPVPNLSGRIPELDGLRGIAIGMVLIYHYFLVIIQVPPGSVAAYLLATGRLTWSGVDLFFVLSGFLIGGILLDARGSSNFFRVFYARRFFRIVPIYGIFLFGFFAFLLLIRSGKAPAFADVPMNEIPWLAYPVFLQNFWMVAKNTMGMIVLSATWSLAIEEQFYLTLPSLVHFFDSRRLLQIVIGGILSAPILRIALRYFYPRNSFSYGYLMPCRADALLLGVLGAILLRNSLYRGWLEKNYRLLQILLFLLVGGAAFLTIKSPSGHDYLMSTIGFTWLAVLYACVILYALTQKGSLLGSFLRTKWLGSLGTIAYGTYLLHTPVLLLISRPFWPKPMETNRFSDLWVSVLALVITLVICRFSWLYFEKPLVKLGHSSDYKFASAGSIASPEPGQEPARP